MERLLYPGILKSRNQSKTAVILDEADYTLLDMKNYLVMLSSPMPTFDQLLKVMLTIWQLTLNMQSNILYGGFKNIL